ncbi:unnamed protein product [Clonostachys byssicola]|uniref:diphosphoinositol-polyphosphate diphosphatase n=1 Tax=Clonostachys byssicola TaxID=160290 RepID=A0A9N9UZ69_9HYPO|nr:unnamed protein product [Clonostachys byssicola]
MTPIALQHPDHFPYFDEDTMTSKRNSRVFTEENSAHDQNRSMAQQKQQTSAYRSRRNSRSSSKDELSALAEKMGDAECNRIPSTDSDLPSRSHGGVVAIGKGLSAEVLAPGDVKVIVECKVSRKESEDFSSPPLAGRPNNFGMVIPGVYRSSYPKAQDFEYLRGLKLKTLVTLVKKDEIDQDLVSFAASNDIHQVVFNMKGTKKESIPLQTMKSILEVVLDRRNHPLLIHCNQGKHRTGCVVAVVRKVAGWNASSVLDEYRAFAEPKIRESDVEYIRNFEISALYPLATEHHSRYTPIQVRSFRRTLVFSTIIMLLWVVSGTQLLSTRKELTS